MCIALRDRHPETLTPFEAMLRFFGYARILEAATATGIVQRTACVTGTVKTNRWPSFVTFFH